MTLHRKGERGKGGSLGKEKEEMKEKTKRGKGMNKGFGLIGY